MISGVNQESIIIILIFVKQIKTYKVMPNHIANRLLVSGSEEEIARFTSTVETVTINENDCEDVEHIDFNKIIPMPEELKNTESSSKVHNSLYYYLMMTGKSDLVPQLLRFPQFYSLEKFEDKTTDELAEYMSIGEKYYHLYEKYEYCNWYDWCVMKWGTKWNAYNTYIESDSATHIEMFFNTAWSGVPEIIAKLAEMFPELTFEYSYADEDYGYNTGCGYAECGELSMSYPAPNSDDAMRIYWETHQCDEDTWYRDDEGYWHNREWEYDEDEE